MKCWKKSGKNWKNRNLSLEVRKVSFRWEKPAHNVVVYDKEIESYESSLGKTVFVKHLGKKSEATKFAKSYMEHHDTC